LTISTVYIVTASVIIGLLLKKSSKPSNLWNG